MAQVVERLASNVRSPEFKRQYCPKKQINFITNEKNIVFFLID
jgi:hypothetical protein